MSEWLKEMDCKSIGICLHRFKSYSTQKKKKFSFFLRTNQKLRQPKVTSFTKGYDNALCLPKVTSFTKGDKVQLCRLRSTTFDNVLYCLRLLIFFFVFFFKKHFPYNRVKSLLSNLNPIRDSNKIE